MPSLRERDAGRAGWPEGASTSMLSEAYDGEHAFHGHAALGVPETAGAPRLRSVDLEYTVGLGAALVDVRRRDFPAGVQVLARASSDWVDISL